MRNSRAESNPAPLAPAGNPEFGNDIQPYPQESGRKRCKEIPLQYPQESLRKNPVPSGARRNPSAQGRRYPASRRPLIQFVGAHHDHHGRIDVGYAVQTGKIGWPYFNPRAFRYGWVGVYEKELAFFGTDTDDELVFGRSGDAAVVVKTSPERIP